MLVRRDTLGAALALIVVCVSMLLAAAPNANARPVLPYCPPGYVRMPSGQCAVLAAPPTTKLAALALTPGNGGSWGL
jgi:hypothetical protein